MKAFVKPLLASLLFLLAASAHSQTAGSWCPTDRSRHLHLANAWYDLRTFGSQSRIGFRFAEESYVYLYYFSPSDQVQVQKAAAFYATLLTAYSSGAEVSVHVVGADSTSTIAFVIDAVQIGAD